jgi:hypothetical protein
MWRNPADRMIFLSTSSCTSGPRNSVLAVAFLAGVRVVPGAIHGSKGLTLTFNRLPVSPIIPMVSYQFQRVNVDLGASRKIMRKVRSRTRRKTVRVRVVRRIDLVRTPPDCASGAWQLQASLGLPGGTTAVLGAPVAC